MLFNELNINRHIAFKYLPAAFGVQMNMFIYDTYKLRNRWLLEIKTSATGWWSKNGAKHL
jgi:hypothetical protein